MVNRDVDNKVIFIALIIQVTLVYMLESTLTTLGMEQKTLQEQWRLKGSLKMGAR